jgi:uncharacterized protein (TIGR03437 family)
MRLFASGLCLFPLIPLTVYGQTVRFETNLGNIDVQLLPSDAPKTVANFLAYLNAKAYANSFIHRSVPGFVIQGGGYQWSDANGPVAIPQNAPVVNEFKVSNTRGTVAMAKLGNDPNSATSQWFFNEVDNSSNLDNTNGGFTVFGKVADDASLAVMDHIANEPVYDASGTFGADFSNLPLVNYTGTFTSQNLVLITAILVVPGIGSNGVIAPSDFGGASTAAVGSYLEIYGTNLAGTTRAWRTSDFSNGNAPTTLDKVSATINGTPAYVSFVSPAQVNVEVPAGVAAGTASVILTYNGTPSAPVNFAIEAAGGSILAPTSFKVNGKQFVGAYHVNGAPVTNGNIPGLPAAPAVPGETLLFYGLGFGPLKSGAAIAGKIATGQTALSNPVEFLFGDSKLPGKVQYQGLAPGFVGLYQFNVTVPANAPSGDLALQVSQSGKDLPQTLYISVK